MLQTREITHDTPPRGPDRLIRFADGLEMLGLSKSTAYRMLHQRALPRTVKIGALTFFSERELQDWIAEKLASRFEGGNHA